MYEAVHTFNRYKNNLRLEQDYDGDLWVSSYDTLVALIQDGELIQSAWYSKTTQKHINYVAKELQLTLIKTFNKH